MKIKPTSDAKVMLEAVHATFESKDIDYEKMTGNTANKKTSNKRTTTTQNITTNVTTNVKTKVDTSELKKLNGIKDIEVLVTPTLSKNAQETITEGIKKIVAGVNKEFSYNKPPKTTWKAIEKYVPELDNHNKGSVKAYVTNYEKRIGKSLSEKEKTELTDRYTKIKRIEKAITQLESDLNKHTGAFPSVSSMDPDAIKKNRQSAQLLYSLRKALNEINVDDGKQLRSDIIKKINKTDPKFQYDQIRKYIMQSIYEGSGISEYLNSVNKGKEFNSNQFGKYTKKIDDGIKAIEDSYNAKEALKVQNEYNKMFDKMSRFRSQKPEQSKKNVNKILKDYQGKTRDSKDIEAALDELKTPTKIMNFLGDYAVYKKNGNKPNDVIENYIKNLSEEYELAKSTISDILSMTDDQFIQKLSEIKAPKVDTKPLQEAAKETKESEEIIRDEIKKTDKVIEDSNKEQKKVSTAKKTSSKNNLAQQDVYYSDDEWDYAKSRNISYKLALGKDFTTVNKKESRKQLTDAFNVYDEAFLDDVLNSYYGTIAEYIYFKSYSDAIAKGVKFNLDNDVDSYLTDAGHLNDASKLFKDKTVWEEKLQLAKQRLLMYASVYDQIDEQIGTTDKSIFKNSDILKQIESLVQTSFMSKYSRKKATREANLGVAIVEQDNLNRMINELYGKDNVVKLISDKGDITKYRTKQKQQESQKIVESNNAISDSEEKVAETEKKTAEQRSNKKSTIKAKQEEAKAIVDANSQEAESEKELAETKQEIAKQKKKTETADSKKKNQEKSKENKSQGEKPKVIDTQKSEEKPVSTTPPISPTSHSKPSDPIKPNQTTPIETPTQVPVLPDTNTEESKKQLEGESKAFKEVEDSAKKAAAAKESFDKANKKVAAGAEKSSESLEKERQKMKAVSEEAIPDKGDSDKLITVKDADGNVRSHTQVKTEKNNDAYITTSTTYSPTDEGTLEVSSERIVEDMKRLKTEAEKESVKVQKANKKLDKFISNLDIQMGGKINAMQLDGYMGLKHISSVDEIDGIVKSMERVEAEKKKIFASSKTNQKDLFGITELPATVSNVVSAFNALTNPSEQLSESIGKMMDLNKSLKEASGIYEQAETAGKLRDAIAECNTQIKQQQNLEKDNKRLSDANKKNTLFYEKQKAREQELNEFEQRMKDTFKYSDQVESQIGSLRNILSEASANIDLSIFDTKFKALKKSEKSLPIVTESFKSNWDNYLGIIDKNNESIIKEKEKQDRDNFIKNLQNITEKTPDLPTEDTSVFVADIKKETTDTVKKVISLQNELSSIYNSVATELKKDESTRDKNFIYEQKTLAKKKESLKKQLENSDLFKNREEFIDENLEYDYMNSTNKLNKADKSVNDQEALNKQGEQTKQIVDQYDKALSKVKELEKAQNELFSIQKAQFDNPYNDMSQDIDAAKNKVTSLKTETERLFKSQDIKDRSILGDKKVDDLQNYYDKVNKNSENNRKLENLMVDAYKSYRNAEKNVFKNIGSKDSASLSSEIERMKVFEKEYNRLKNEVYSTKGTGYQNSEIANLENSFNVKNSELLKKNISSISDAIEDFKSKFGNKDGAASIMANDFIKPYEDAFNKVKDKISQGIQLTSKDFDDIFNVKKAIEEGPGSLSDGFMRKYNEAYKLLDKLNSYTNIKGKSSSYGSILQSFTKEINDLANDKNMPDEDKIKKIIDVYDRLYDFSKNAKAFDLNNNKGRLVEGTESYMKSAEDVVNYLRDYAKSVNLGKEISSSISDTGQVTMQFQNQSGAVTTLKGSIEQYTQALRMMSSEQTKTGSSFKTFGSALKSIAGGSFKDILQMVTSYVSSYRIMSTMISQLQQGFSTLKSYDDNLTTISYTMDITKEQLDSLGQSAIDMAQDLSMSLENAMDIYQIYANMNTTAEEINETAKPTAILSNLSGVDTSTAADQVQGILQQFNMLEDGSQSAADASMHVVDVLDKISSNVAIDYARGIKVISDAVQASGQVAYDAGMSYEQLAAVSAKVAERTREDGGSIGNAIKTNILSLRTEMCAM